MNMQELLTYVEELTFKTSMFGYDKDEVFQYDETTRKIIADLWSRVKVAASNAH